MSRVAGTVTFPSRFMTVAAMNPCKCGYKGHPKKQCTCSPFEASRYISRISGPLLDRIDIQIEVPSLSYDELSTNTKAEPSSKIRERVNKARKIAQKRFVGEKTDNSSSITCNAQMEAKHIAKYCELDDACKNLMNRAFKSLGLSARGHDRILRLARTIADLADSEKIMPNHLAEAIQLRSLDKKYF